MRRIAVTVLFVVTVLMGLAPAALAAKPSKPTGGGGTSTLRLVVLDGPDGVPNWGEHVTFDVSTTATSRPYVSLDCYQNGAWVLSGSAGFFPDYTWGQTFALSSSSWTSGAANCVANLHYSTSNGRKVTLATLAFDVAA